MTFVERTFGSFDCQTLLSKHTLFILCNELVCSRKSGKRSSHRRCFKPVLMDSYVSSFFSATVANTLTKDSLQEGKVYFVYISKS